MSHHSSGFPLDSATWNILKSSGLLRRFRGKRAGRVLKLNHGKMPIKSLISASNQLNIQDRCTRSTSLTTTCINRGQSGINSSNLLVPPRIPYTHQTLRVIWPKDLERFDADEVVERAERRHRESYYDFLKNNCEHFVTWCKCGLNVKLQVRDWYIKARDAEYSVCAGGIEYFSSKEVKPLVVKAAVPFLANVSDEIAVSANAGAKEGFAVGGIFEVDLAAYQIKQAHNQYREHVLIKSKEEFAVKTAKILAKGYCRFTGGCVGSVVGSAMGPVGSLVGGTVGGAFGAAIGNLVGSFFDRL